MTVAARQRTMRRRSPSFAALAIAACIVAVTVTGQATSAPQPPLAVLSVTAPPNRTISATALQRGTLDPGTAAATDAQPLLSVEVTLQSGFIALNGSLLPIAGGFYTFNCSAFDAILFDYFTLESPPPVTPAPDGSTRAPAALSTLPELFSSIFRPTAAPTQCSDNAISFQIYSSPQLQFRLPRVRGDPTDDGIVDVHVPVVNVLEPAGVVRLVSFPPRVRLLTVVRDQPPLPNVTDPPFPPGMPPAFVASAMTSITPAVALLGGIGGRPLAGLYVFRSLSLYQTAACITAAQPQRATASNRVEHLTGIAVGGGALADLAGICLSNAVILAAGAAAHALAGVLSVAATGTNDKVTALLQQSSSSKRRATLAASPTFALPRKDAALWDAWLAPNGEDGLLHRGLALVRFPSLQAGILTAIVGATAQAAVSVVLVASRFTNASIADFSASSLKRTTFLNNATTEEGTDGGGGGEVSADTDQDDAARLPTKLLDDSSVRPQATWAVVAAAVIVAELLYVFRQLSIGFDAEFTDDPNPRDWAPKEPESDNRSVARSASARSSQAETDGVDSDGEPRRRRQINDTEDAEDAHDEPPPAHNDSAKAADPEPVGDPQPPEWLKGWRDWRDKWLSDHRGWWTPLRSGEQADRMRQGEWLLRSLEALRSGTGAKPVPAANDSDDEAVSDAGTATPAGAAAATLVAVPPPASSGIGDMPPPTRYVLHGAALRAASSGALDAAAAGPPRGGGALLVPPRLQTPAVDAVELTAVRGGGAGRDGDASRPAPDDVLDISKPLVSRSRRVLNEYAGVVVRFDVNDSPTSSDTDDDGVAGVRASRPPSSHRSGSSGAASVASRLSLWKEQLRREAGLSARTFLDRAGHLFAGFTKGRQWYLAFELGITLVFAAFAGASVTVAELPADTTHAAGDAVVVACQRAGRLAAVALLAGLALAAAVTAKPFGPWFDRRTAYPALASHVASGVVCAAAQSLDNDTTRLVGVLAVWVALLGACAAAAHGLGPTLAVFGNAVHDWGWNKYERDVAEWRERDAKAAADRAEAEAKAEEEARRKAEGGGSSDDDAEDGSEFDIEAMRRKAKRKAKLKRRREREAAQRRADEEEAARAAEAAREPTQEELAAAKKAATTRRMEVLLGLVENEESPRRFF